MIDLNEIDRLEKDATGRPWSEFRFMHLPREDALLIEAVRNKLPEILDEMFAAREWLRLQTEVMTFPVQFRGQRMLAQEEADKAMHAYRVIAEGQNDRP